MIWIADAKLSRMVKKWRGFGIKCGFYREMNKGGHLCFDFLGLTLNGPSGRIYEPNYNKRA